MELNLANKRVVVTGGSKGIGLAIATAFAREGAKVVIVSRDRSHIDQALDSLANAGMTLTGYAANLSQFDQAEAVVKQIEAEQGPIDILINSAGAAKRFLPEALDGQALRAGMEDKFFPVANAQEAVLVAMRERKRGVIVNIVGVGGKVPSASHISGGAANAALMLSTVAHAHYYATFGIRINAINPGFTLTGRVQQSVTLDAARLGINEADALAAGQAKVPLGRYADVAEIADAALFLASDRASYIVGAILPVDGGLHPLI